MKAAVGIFASMLVLAAATVPCLARDLDMWGQNLWARDALAKQEFAKLDAAYLLVQAQSDRDPDGRSEAEILHHTITYAPLIKEISRSIGPMDLARKWTAASPDSVLAATFLATMAIDAAKARGTSKNWREQETQTNEALEQLKRAESRGKSDVMWHATYMTLMSQAGATPKQVVGYLKNALEHVSQPSPDFFKRVVDAVRLDGEDGLVHIREIATLAAAKTAQHSGKAMYGLVYVTAFDTKDLLQRNPFAYGMDWKTVDAAIIDLTRRYPDRDTSNTHAMLACIAGDRGRTAQLMKQLPPPLADAKARWRYFSGSDQMYQRCEAWANEKPALA